MLELQEVDTFAESQLKDIEYRHNSCLLDSFLAFSNLGLETGLDSTDGAPRAA